MRLKWPELLQNRLGVGLWFGPQPPRCLRGEEGQVQELVEGRAQRLHLFWVQGSGLPGTSGGSGGKRWLSGGTLGQGSLLLIIVIILLPLLLTI